MRDPKRIDKILNQIKKYWKENPDQRFNQMLINLGLIPDGSHWNIQDDIIEKQLKANK